VRANFELECNGCGRLALLAPLHGPEKGGPLRCFVCAGAWHAEHGRKHKTGRVVIRAIKAFVDAGGSVADVEKLKLTAILRDSAFGLGGELDPLGYMAETAATADETVLLTSEVLAGALRLTHPDVHLPERRELASRVTQQLLALQPFVFPAAKPKTDAPYKPSRDDSVKVSVRNFEKPLHQRYPCPECSSAVPMDYCTACRAEWDKRRHEEQVLINARQRKWYAQRQARLTTGKPPTPCVACGTVINSKRKDARFCSGACRQRAHRRALPQARAAADWVAKRLADIPPGAENKDLARTRAIARWPARADLFARKCDVDRAEACLIALAGLKREARNV
jgi:hypothetical protein